jgi:hypothetical protein
MTAKTAFAVSARKALESRAESLAGGRAVENTKVFTVA